MWLVPTGGLLMTSSGSTDDKQLTTAPAAASSLSSRTSATSVGGGTTLDTITIWTVVIGVSGAVANVLVLCGVICSNARRNATNIFICNQIVLDFIACFSLTFSNLMIALSNADGAAGWILCFLFTSNTLLVVPIYASQAGLVIITVERYAKIVHPVAHRKHFQPWMIKAGVVAPWLVGVVTYLIPNWSTTRFVNGTCLSFKFWPTSQMFSAYSSVIFFIMLVIPLAIFAFCYGSIFYVVRRQARQVIATATAAPPTAGSSAASNGTSRSQRKVVRTLLVVCASYTICWFPIKFYILASVVRWVTPVGDIFLALTMFSYINMIVNPMIYVTHFKFTRHFWQAKCDCFKKRGEDIVKPVSDTSNDNTAPTAAAAGGAHASR